MLSTQHRDKERSVTGLQSLILLGYPNTSDSGTQKPPQGSAQLPPEAAQTNKNILPTFPTINPHFSSGHADVITNTILFFFFLIRFIRKKQTIVLYLVMNSALPWLQPKHEDPKSLFVVMPARNLLLKFSY